MTRNVEELFGGVITAPHQIPFTYKSNVGGETFLSLPFYPVTGVVTINGGMQVPLDNFEIDGNTLNLGRALSKGDVVYCLFDKILSPEDTAKGIRIYKFQAVGGETEFTPDFTSYGVQSLYIGGEYKTPEIEYSYDSTTGKVSLQTALTAGVWVVAEMSVKQPNISPAFDRSIQEIARSANVKDSEVIVSTDTISLLDGKKVIYDIAAQTSYGLPTIPDGSVISSVSNGQLTYNPGNIAVSLVPVPNSAEELSVELGNNGGQLVTTKSPIANTIRRSIDERNSDVISLKDFVLPSDLAEDYSPAIARLMVYLETLSTIKYVGTGADCGGIIIDAPGNIKVTQTINFKNTRNLTLRDWSIKPHSNFTRGDYLLAFTSNVVDQYAHENLKLSGVTLDGVFEANCLSLQDFLRVKVVDCSFYRFFEYGIRTENINNGSHELMASNIDIFQSFDGTYPAHIINGIGLQNENNDNHLNNSVIGPVFSHPIVCTDYVSPVKSGGGAFFMSNTHTYSARRTLLIDAAGVYINNCYFDGDLIVASKRKLSINNCFFQVVGSVGNVNFITNTGDVGEWNIKDNNFVNRDNAPNVRMMPSLSGVNVYESFIQDNAGTNVTKVRVFEDDVQSQTFTPTDWTQTADGNYVETTFPAYKGNRQATVTALSVEDRTRMFTVIRVGTVLRVYCWYTDGSGKAVPTANIVVSSSGRTAPDVGGTV
ncbi:tail fiber protein [Salmonella phage vB-SalM-SJ2]|uniref:Tailspike protein n=1 Tax=Salmonella phage vB-SalM-SJ2 TaxID=1458849 RepID=W8JYV1_9CAUD|nr:tail fiber protein [Salmonella phage vB-SalM-SJ2]AHK61503.1 hypothetical protein [Salmonella phage vB-SalM-SJ2]